MTTLMKLKLFYFISYNHFKKDFLKLWRSKKEKVKNKTQLIKLKSTVSIWFELGVQKLQLWPYALNIKIYLLVEFSSYICTLLKAKTQLNSKFEGLMHYCHEYQ